MGLMPREVQVARRALERRVPDLPRLTCTLVHEVTSPQAFPTYWVRCQASGTTSGPDVATEDHNVPTD